MMLSTVSTTSVEDVAEAAGSPVLVLTTDLPVSSNRLSLARFIKRDRRDCAQCHTTDLSGSSNRTFAHKPMFDGLDVEGAWNTPGMDWTFVDRLKKATKLKLVVKGVTTAEDAQRCIAHGADGIVVSNHGGRAAESGRGAIDCLPEITRVVRKQVPVIFDSGIRRGTDVFKALALGADAVGIGRPYLWALGTFGQPGVERVLRLLRAELKTVMALSGARTLKAIDRAAVIRNTLG